ncbi:MAG: hypothetical protein CVU71_16575 [Deltaproteobacteria bacterium HGW-Deltaproteobacteria-6]|nr:MAG: hypothetical protein CVU71_16575 [Deltaproteobacteria bacterium HGW-Deltaproteobacteria-6]
MKNAMEGEQAELSGDGKDPVAAGGYKTASGITIDFHSAEFNFQDDLSDLNGNCRTFQTLDGVVTADMLHQMKIRHCGGNAALSSDKSVLPNHAGRGNEADESTNLPSVSVAQFTLFQETRCLHGRSRKSGCGQCLAVCPQKAIQSAGGRISFNHDICRGCGSCALVCPTDAIQLVYPSQAERLDALRRLLTGHAPVTTLIISDDEDDRYATFPMDECSPDHKIMVMDHISHVGAEMLLAALIYGAGNVVVVCDPENTPAVIDAVRWQTRLGRAILRGLGAPEDRIRFTVPPDNHQSEKEIFVVPDCAMPADEPFPLPDEFSHQPDKRTLLRMAVQRLHDRFNAQQPSLPLPDGSPFGTIVVDSTCTLCMACVDACPSKALLAAGSVPKLELIESRCHQCRLCEDICPEKSIRLQPRMLCDPDRLETAVALHESQTARCIACGIPFASQAMINRIQNNLAGHWMFGNERQLSRLQMCRTCRTRDALLSEDMKTWNQFPVR